MTRTTVTLAGLLREPDRPLTPRRWFGYLGRLTVFYLGIGIFGAATMLVFALLAALWATHAHASAPQAPPDGSSASGCAIILPDPSRDDPGRSTALQVRTTRPLSECDGSAPVNWGASVLDGYVGRAR